MQRLIYFLALLICFCSRQVQLKSVTCRQPSSAFNETYQIIVLIGGVVYGIPDPINRTTKHVCKPQRVDVIIVSGKILNLMKPSKTPSFINSMKSHGMKVLQISVQDQVVMPGLIDPHIHAIGGGGEQGPYSRTPESRLSQLINGGLTTIAGILGTDGITRSLSSLLQKMKSLEYDGLTTWMWSGSYRIPIATITGSLQHDLLFIDKVLGSGELALSDHRSSWPSKSELVQLLSDARVAGMLSGKLGVIYFHVGSSPTKLDLLWQILNETTIPIRHMYLTHMSSRGDELVEEARKWLKAGGVCDFTADAEEFNRTDTVDALNNFRNEKLPLEQITISNHFLSYDSSGHLISYGMSSPELPLKTIQNLVLKYSWPLEEAIQFSTSNPAKYFKFERKGFYSREFDADIIILNQTDFTLLYVIGKGQILKTPTWIKHDMFEQAC